MERLAAAGGLEGKKCDGEERGVRVFIGRREE